ncbi:MAG: sulfotransferase [Phycisphaerales bacterium]
MPLPHFLIIGAMKAGTTTLYRDLLTHPRVFFPQDKEPGNLLDDAVLDGAGRAAYEAMFAGASADQLCAEASTAYTKRPTHEGVAQRARELLGPDLRLIYIMREPVERLISQHRHELTAGEIAETDIDAAIERHPRLIDYSRYAMQLEPWLERFGTDRVLTLEMEAYAADRAGGCAVVQRFLGLDPRPDLVRTDAVYNRGDGKPVLRGPWQVVQQSPVYQRLLRPMIGVEMRQRLRETLLPKARAGLARPSDASLHAIRDRLRPDLERLAELLGERTPSWAGTPDAP